MTKKMGILKLPPAFWMKDPKVNPLAEHLFWASLLLRDRERIEMALFVLEAEQEESRSGGKKEGSPDGDKYVQGLLDELFVQFPEAGMRKWLARELAEIVPDVLKPKVSELL